MPEPGYQKGRNKITSHFLIINADDLGLWESVNEGIFQAARQGVVTSTSIMANGCAFKQAVERLRDYPELDVGIHLTLVVEKPLSPPDRIRTLAGSDGRLPRTWVKLLGLLTWTRKGLQDAERECRTQIERLLDAGIYPSHLDSHQHVHFFPPLWKIVLQLAHEYNIPWVRGPRQDWSLGLLKIKNGAWFKKPILACAQFLGKQDLRHSNRLRAVIKTMGILESGQLGEKELLRLLGQVSNGVTELICHPGYVNPGLLRFISEAGYLRYQWEEELMALTSVSIREQVERYKIELTTFRALAMHKKL